MSVNLPAWLHAAIVDAGHRREPVEASEFCHGRGLSPPKVADAPPRLGGRYRGRTPSVEPDVQMAQGVAGSPGGPWIEGR